MVLLMVLPGVHDQLPQFNPASRVDRLAVALALAALQVKPSAALIDAGRDEPLAIFAAQRRCGLVDVVFAAIRLCAQCPYLSEVSDSGGPGLSRPSRAMCHAAAMSRRRSSSRHSAWVQSAPQPGAGQ